MLQTEQREQGIIDLGPGEGATYLVRENRGLMIGRVKHLERYGLANEGVPTAPRAARRSFQNATTSSRLKFGELSLGGQMCGYKS